jgi:hypothetical protein
MAPVNRLNAALAADPLVGRARVRRGSRCFAVATRDFLLERAGCVGGWNRESEGHGQSAA